MSGQRSIAVWLAAALLAGGFALGSMAEEPSPDLQDEQATSAAAVRKQGSKSAPFEAAKKESADRTRGARSEAAKQFRPSIRVPAGDSVSFPVDI